jgi:hypothetical protein
MAVLTAKGISSLAIDLLVRSIVLPRTVSIIPGGEFSGSNGDTITVRVPQPGSARTQQTRSATITYDDVTEVPVDVQLAHLYHAKLTSDEEMTLDIENFGRQVTRVQVAAVATGAEDTLAKVMNDLTPDGEVDAADPEDGILAAREFLGENDAPSDDRYLAVSPAMASVLLQYDKFSKVNEAGSSDALRNAILGRIFGFWVVESNALTAGTAVAYHRSGFTMANRIPVAPRGANDSSTATSQGLGLRQVFQYVPDKLSDASVVSTFAGAAAVYEDESDDVKRFFKLELGS